MKVYKFGGASVKDAASVRNLADIVKSSDRPLVVVISAMGKTTNALEKILRQYFDHDNSLRESVDKLFSFHFDIVKDLFRKESEIIEQLQKIFDKLYEKLSDEPTMTYNFEYDQIVSYGEIISTTIVNAYLNESGCSSEWYDIRKILKTDENYREAKVDFETSAEMVRSAFNTLGNHVYVTQGFIGSTKNNLTTTLGREGSDYTAALLAYFLDAESVTVWKDVPGVLNADPKWFDNTVKLDSLSYTDAVELAFYGASVIHPKTIQPLKQKKIPLWVKSFVETNAKGTLVGETHYKELIPCFIFKMDQVLIDIFPTDLSFIAEDNLQDIFAVFSKFGLKVNIMQNTAVHFSVCVNNDKSLLEQIINELKQKFQVSVTKDLELITIRYYDTETINRVIVNKELVLEQRSRTTIQMLVKDKG
ncbi:MAG: aspartate kinase [Bacteroidales bacterium]|nr:aspartate kinase [Bacteroidales bacterium]